MLINELYYDPLQTGTDAAYEWFELLNRTSTAIDLTGWSVADNHGIDDMPSLTLPPGGLGIVAASPAFYDEFPSFDGNIAFIADGRIGNGLSNGGDRLSLIGPAGGVIDALSYGDDSTLMSPPCPGAGAGHSLERPLAGLDTDRASDFVENSEPTPGDLWAPPPTQTPTPAPSPALVETPSPSPAASPAASPSSAAPAPTPTAYGTYPPTPAPTPGTFTESGATPVPAAGPDPGDATSPTLGLAATPVPGASPGPGRAEASMWLYAVICISAVLVGSVSVAGIRRLRRRG